MLDDDHVVSVDITGSRVYLPMYTRVKRFRFVSKASHVYMKQQAGNRGRVYNEHAVLRFSRAIAFDLLFTNPVLRREGRVKHTRPATSNPPCLRPSSFRFVQEIKWPSAEERANHGAFLREFGHPDLANVAYVVDGTKVKMRNPAKVTNKSCCVSCKEQGCIRQVIGSMEVLGSSF